MLWALLGSWPDGGSWRGEDSQLVPTATAILLTTTATATARRYLRYRRIITERDKALLYAPVSPRYGYEVSSLLLIYLVSQGLPYSCCWSTWFYLTLLQPVARMCP